MWIQAIYRNKEQKETFTVSANGNPEQVFYNWKDFQAYCIEAYTKAGIRKIEETDIRIFIYDLPLIGIEGLRAKKSELLERIADGCLRPKADGCEVCSKPCER